MNTKFTYNYRDAENYSRENVAIVKGALNECQIQDIYNRLDAGEFFIPRQVNLPERRFDHWTEADHCWFEMCRGDITLTEEAPNTCVTAEEVWRNFLNVTRWNDMVDVQDYASTNYDPPTAEFNGNADAADAAPETESFTEKSKRYFVVSWDSESGIAILGDAENRDRAIDKLEEYFQERLDGVFGYTDEEIEEIVRKVNFHGMSSSDEYSEDTFSVSGSGRFSIWAGDYEEHVEIVEY